MQGEGEKPRRQQVHVQQETGYHDYDRLANGSPAYHLPSLPEVLPYVHPSGSQNSTESPLNIGESHASSTVRYLVISSPQIWTDGASRYWPDQRTGHPPHHRPHPLLTTPPVPRPLHRPLIGPATRKKRTIKWP